MAMAAARGAAGQRVPSQAERCDTDEEGADEASGAPAHLRIRLLDGSVIHQVRL
jgi:hypothetical protein